MDDPVDYLLYRLMIASASQHRYGFGDDFRIGVPVGSQQLVLRGCREQRPPGALVAGVAGHERRGSEVVVARVAIGVLDGHAAVRRRERPIGNGPEPPSCRLGPPPVRRRVGVRDQRPQVFRAPRGGVEEQPGCRCGDCRGRRVIRERQPDALGAEGVVLCGGNPADLYAGSRTLHEDPGVIDGLDLIAIDGSIGALERLGDPPVLDKGGYGGGGRGCAGLGSPCIFE